MENELTSFEDLEDIRDLTEDEETGVSFEDLVDIRDLSDDDGSDDSVFGEMEELTLDNGSYVTSDLNKWLNENEQSPVRFLKNNISEIENPIHYEVVFKYDSGEITSEDMVSTVYCPVSSLKSLGYPCSGFEPVNETPKADNLVLYGHNLDFDNRFNSRIDTLFFNENISDSFNTKFKNVILYGAFESIQDMKQSIDTVYNKMTDKLYGGSVSVYLDSKVKDDDGNERTLVNLLCSGYIPNLVDSYTPVKFIYKKFPKRMTARLFTDEIEDEVKDLF